MRVAWVFLIWFTLGAAFQVVVFLLFGTRSSTEFAAIIALALTYIRVEDTKREDHEAWRKQQEERIHEENFYKRTNGMYRGEENK